MKVLAFDLSSELRSVALTEWTGGEARLIAHTADANFRTKTIAVMVDELLREAQLAPKEIEGIALGLGPGSYTGIRISLAFAQGWQLATGCKTVGISSTHALAASARAAGIAGPFDVLIDAQRNEVYVESYFAGETLTRTCELRILTVDQWRAARTGPAVGPQVHRWDTAGLKIQANALEVSRLARTAPNFVCAEELQPIYLRETSFVKAGPLNPVLQHPAISGQQP